MKRLLWYLNQITDNNTTTFRYTVKGKEGHEQKEIYDGECVVTHLKPNGETVSDRQSIERNPTYWRDGIAYTFDRTNRMALDRPTVTIAIPADRLGITSFTPAAADFCLRAVAPYFDAANSQYVNKSRPDRDNGKFYVYKPGGAGRGAENAPLLAQDASGEILIRNTAYFALCPAKDYENGRGAGIFVTEFVDLPPDRMCLCLRIEIQLPHGKLKRMRKMLTSDLPGAAEHFVREFDREGLDKALALEQTQEAIRAHLRIGEYCAFIANGSILPREKGTSLPMKDALPFKSTPEDEIEIDGVRGMGIRRGVTVITGGGYSGKSTLLNAISAGIYNHIAGDGRELCITDETAVTITAEDGRSVSCLNISPFIKWIPGGDPRAFSTDHASGSTSQAANIIEAIACGAKLLLVDEDRSATNFMIRDALMKQLIEKEPITPFTDRVGELSARGVSTVLVIGGSGEYLSVADKIYMMEDFIINDATDRAKKLVSVSGEFGKVKARENTVALVSPTGKPEKAGANRNTTAFTSPEQADWTVKRMLYTGNFTAYPEGSGSERLEVSDTGFIIIGDERIDIRTLHDLATPAQTDALAFMLRYLENKTNGDDTANSLQALEELAASMRGISRRTQGHAVDIDECVCQLYECITQEGLNLVDTGFFTGMNRFLELPRPIELLAAIYRMRRVTWSIG